MYRITNKETGQVYHEADTIDELSEWYMPIHRETGIRALSIGRGEWAFNEYTPELLRLIEPHYNRIGDVLAGILMLTLIVVLSLGMGGMI